jgi:soluble P-type ATPase
MSGGGLDGSADAGLVEHHVEVTGVPERREDLAADPERRAPVVIGLERVW